jgi:hypothetical protein
MIEAKLVRKLSDNTTIGELVGLGGYCFNAVRRNVRFAPISAIRRIAMRLSSVSTQVADRMMSVWPRSRIRRQPSSTTSAAASGA